MLRMDKASELNRIVGFIVYIIVHNRKIIYLFLKFLMNQTKQIDDYQIYIHQKLGQGVKKSTKMFVAVKIISKLKWYDQQRQLQQFTKEITIMKSLNHPNIVKCFDALQTKKNLYIIEELCDSDLSSYLQNNKQNISEEKAVEILKQICSGCLYLILKGIVYRDLKPQNILISQKTFKLGDFGQAKRNITKYIVNSTLVGTPGYMAPQIMQHNNYNSKCDIWSIGVIFYQILYGKLPWSGKGLQQIRANTEKFQLYINKKKFNYTTVDFLKKALKLKESDRFTWQQLFSHSIFNNKFKEYVEHTKQIRKNHDLFIQTYHEELIKHIQNSKKDLNYFQFKQFLIKMNLSFTKQQRTYSFQALDFDGNGFISVSQVHHTASKLKPKHFNIKYIHRSKQHSEHLLQRVFKFFLKIKNKCQQQNCTFTQVFCLFSNKNTMNINELSSFLHSFGLELNQEQVQQMFSYFDKKNEQLIEFKTFREIYRKFTQWP